jgi:alpha-ketoglutarate-dependent taurine dioxygenase
MKSLEIEKLTDTFVVEIKNVDIAQGIDSEQLKLLANALMEHKVLLFREQNLTTEQYSVFGRQWSEKTRIDSFTEMHVPGFNDMNQVGNVGELFKDEGYRNGAAFWHTDCAAEPDPNAITMLYCIHALESEGETVFADMESAYSALDENTKNNITSLTAWHCYAGAKPILGGRETWEHTLTPVNSETKSNFPDPVQRPLVRKHSVTEKPCLYGAAGSMFKIDGMEPSRANDLMKDLKSHATRPEFCYAHQYRVGDVVMWDNTSTLHFATPTSAATGEHDKRLMYRMSPLGLPSSLT